MLIVAGLSLKNIKPRVWDPGSPFHIPGLRAVMVSYAEFHRKPVHHRQAMEQGLHTYLGLPDGVQVYLDNGAFAFLRRGGETPRATYREFVASARPDWWPIPQDFIPTPWMSDREQRACFARTMSNNRAYEHDGYVPVVHIGRMLEPYLAAIAINPRLAAKPVVALGGIVPNLLRAPKAMPYENVLAGLQRVRRALAGRQIHLFGVGGTATLHLAALFDIDSVDSSGWRNRAARGIVQLPGSGDRVVADLGNWRGREPSSDELEVLAACRCPACMEYGLDGLRGAGVSGFCNRAAHNLWVLLKEAQAIEAHIADGSYEQWVGEHLKNSTYLPLIRRALALRTAV